MRFLKALLTFSFLAFPAKAEEEALHSRENWIESDKVVLQGLDKVSARVFTSTVFVNQKVHFGSLEIYVRSAVRSPPEEEPESACFLEIFDNKPGQQRQKVFSGWMFSSVPALSALEHAVYDITVKDVVVPHPEGEAALPNKLTEVADTGAQTAKVQKIVQPQDDDHDDHPTVTSGPDDELTSPSD